MSTRPTRASRDLTHLSVEQVLSQPRGRGRGSRSPSPSVQPGANFFPPAFAHHQEDDQEDLFADAEETATMPITDPIPVDADPAEVRRIAEQARQENQAMLVNQERITKALEQATQAAAAAAAALEALSLNARTAPPAASTKRKRPDLPAFDKANIHIWIQRVESAYAREEVTDPKQKFAFLESIIGVNLGPTINNFMFGEATAQNWENFLKHLKDVYGPSKETRCSVYLDGIKRNGLRPSDHLALIRDRAKDVTLDDLQKQLILRELPTDIKKLLQDKVEKLDAKATAALADAHFSKDGQPLNAVTSNCSVAEQQPQPTARVPNDGNRPPDEAGDVNAVQGRSRPPQQGYNNNRNGARNNNPSSFTSAFSSGTSRSRTRASPRRNTTPKQSNYNASPPPTASEERQYSNCKLHAADPNSQVCNGPLCPLHARATLCYSRRCTAHGQGGNGRGGRR